MPKQKQSINWWEISFSIAVIFILVGIFHYIVVNNGFSYVLNPYLFFGLSDIGYVFYLILSLLFFLLIVLFIHKKILSNTAVILLFSGVLINLVDRFVYGGAIDYFKIADFPVFNIPDILITAGMFILAVKIIQKV